MTSLLSASPAERLVLAEATLRNPLWFVREVMGASPWDRQQAILLALQEAERIAVPSCHGSGKTWICALCAIWFLMAHPGSIVITTAPTSRQVEAVLWGEIRQAYRRARLPLGGRLYEGTAEWRLDDEWYALGFSTDDPDRFQGFHRPHVLVILEEAAGIKPHLWPAIESLLASEGARLLAIGNPTEPSGPFYDLCREQGVRRIHISAFDTPNVQAGQNVIPGLVTRDYVDRAARKYGVHSAYYVARVLGEFPQQAIDTLVPLSWIDAAQATYLRTDAPGPEAVPNLLTVDVARFGDDETVIYWRQGKRLRLISASAKEDTMQTAGRVYAAWRATEAGEVRVDAGGVGGGVADRLRELGVKVRDMHFGGAPLDGDAYLMARDEWFFALRDWLDPEQGGELELDPVDDVLPGQLTSIKYRLTSRGQNRIESKDEMKLRGLPSPDHADAAAMAVAPQAEPWELYGDLA